MRRASFPDSEFFPYLWAVCLPEQLDDLEKAQIDRYCCGDSRVVWNRFEKRLSAVSIVR